MKLYTKKTLIISLLLLLNACTPALPTQKDNTENNASKSQTSDTQTKPSSESQNKPTLGEGLPDDINGFQSWFKINSKPIPHSDSSPHTPSKGDKNIYLNRDALPSDYPFSNGTIIVKESLHKSETYVEWISIMRKIKDLDPEHGDWEFHEYTRSGPDDKFKLAFKDNNCFGCHSSAKDTADWVRYLSDKQ